MEESCIEYRYWVMIQSKLTQCQLFAGSVFLSLCLGDLVSVLKHFSNESLKLDLPQPVGVTASVGVREEQFWGEGIKVQV